MSIYDVFSKRNKPLPDTFKYDVLSEKFRNQVAWIWDSTVLQVGNTSSRSLRSYNQILDQTHRIVCSEHGLRSLNHEPSTDDQVKRALIESPDTLLVLDIIEMSFRLFLADCWYIPEGINRQGAIPSLNHRFRENGLGYEYNIDANEIIRIDNTVTHEQAIRPALHLLAGKKYKNANDEFLEALDDYKKHDYDDCLTKCCSAFESVMKIICDKKGWPYQQNQTAATLLATIITKTGLPSFFTDPLTIIATLRNKLSKAHGQGTQTKQPDDFIARYALNATASAILLLHEASH